MSSMPDSHNPSGVGVVPEHSDPSVSIAESRLQSKGEGQGFFNSGKTNEESAVKKRAGYILNRNKTTSEQGDDEQLPSRVSRNLNTQFTQNPKPSIPRYSLKRKIETLQLMEQSQRNYENTVFDQKSLAISLNRRRVIEEENYPYGRNTHARAKSHYESHIHKHPTLMPLTHANKDEARKLKL